MRSSDFGTIPSPAMMGGVGAQQMMARGGHAKPKAKAKHHLVVVAPSPIMGALMAAIMMHQAAGRPRGALSTAAAKKRR
jgi:hypothetical protein